MPCFKPLSAYRSPVLTSKGKLSIVFKATEGYQDMPLTLPCGRCIGCKLERSRQWAVRNLHEASLHKDNCFITLTYSDEFLPPGGTLVKRHFQKFMKDLRSYARRKRRQGNALRTDGGKVRFYHCGEYGESLGRPHYHALLFGLDFSDKELWKTKNGENLYVSETLNKIWGKGFCVIGSVSFDSAAYVSRYCTKKITGDSAEAHYAGRIPEYSTMSRRPGIGHGWLSKFMSESYDWDSVIVRGREMRPPKYYDKQFELADPGAFGKVKRARKSSATAAGDYENSPARLRAREEFAERNLKTRLKRSYENE